MKLVQRGVSNYTGAHSQKVGMASHLLIDAVGIDTSREFKYEINQNYLKLGRFKASF